MSRFVTAGCSHRRSRSIRGAAMHHGGGPCRQRAHRNHRAVVRRRARVELRAVRLTRAQPGFRHQRLRRDAARPVGVGRQAAGRQPRDRRRGATDLVDEDRERVVRACAKAYRERMRSSPRCANSTCGTTTPWSTKRSRPSVDRHIRPSDPPHGRKGALPRQPPGAVEADAGGRWAAPAGQRSAAAHSDRGAGRRGGGSKERTTDECPLRRLSREPGSQPSRACRPIPLRRRWPGKSSAWAASAQEPGWCCCWGATTAIPC